MELSVQRIRDRYNISSAQYGVLSTLLGLTLFSGILGWEMFIYMLVLTISAVFVYYSEMTHSIIDFAPVIVLSFFIAHYYGMFLMITYIVAVNVLPFLAGAGIPDVDTFMYLGALTIVVWISTLFNPANLLWFIGGFLAVYQIISTFISVSIMGAGRGLAISFAEAVMRLVHLLTFGRIVVFVLG